MRFKLCAPALAAALVGVLAAPAPVAAQVSSAFQIDPGHSGGTHFTPALTLPLSQKWQTKLPGPASYPLIAQGMVYLISGGQYQQNDTQLVALDESTGKPVWAQPISGTYFWAGHAYDAGKIYVVNSDGLLTQFDAQTGKPGWSTQLPYQYSFDSPPTATHGMVYTGGSGEGGTLYGVEESTGTVTWTAEVANGDSSSPAVGKTGVYVTYACNNTYAFNPVNGKHVWTHEGTCEGGGGLTPVLAPGLGLFARDTISGNLIFNAKTGAILGSFNAAPPPAFMGDLGFSIDQGQMTGYNYKTGTELWLFPDKSQLTSAPIVVDGTVFVGDSQGTLFGLDAKTGKVAWKTSIGTPISAPGEGFGNAPVAGLGAGDGLVVVPAGNVVTAFGD